MGVLGSKRTTEQRLKMSLAHKPSLNYFKKGHTINLGRKRSDETKKKMSMARIGIKYSDETKEKIRQAQIGRKASEETKQKMSESSPHLSGEKHPNWKGGIRYTIKGYILIYMPEHPFSSKKGYVLEHRLIVEKEINRYLTKDEVVHHINGIKNDNRLENLMLFSNSVEHLKYHKLLREAV